MSVPSATTPHADEIARRGWDVPDFTAEVLAPRAAPWLVIIPVINEGERIRRQLREMAALELAGRIDVAVVDGGSSDGSLDPALLAECGVRALLVKRGPGRLSAQLRCGYAWGLIEGYRGIITIDGNGKDGVETLPRFAEALEAGYGYVQASRFIAGGHHAHTPLLRLLAIRLIHAPLLSLGARQWLTDTTQGYRAYSAEYLLDPRVQPFRAVFSGYELLAYLTVRASQLGYRVCELPTARAYPAGEAVPTKISGLKALWGLIAVLGRTLAGAYHPPREGG